MLPKNLKYGNKVESSPSRSYRTNIAPQNGTGPYGLGETIRLNIPTRNNLILCGGESYLKFDVNVTASVVGSLFRWDAGGCSGLIQKVEIFHGSNLIEQIDNYGLLSKMMFDISVPTDNAYGKSNVLVGTRGDLTSINPNFPATYTQALISNAFNKYSSVYMANNGDVITPTATAGAATIVTATYCLNLLSIIGSLSGDKYLPLFAATSAPLRVEITLVDNFNKCIVGMTSGTDATPSATAPPSLVTMSNVEYVAQFVELGDSAVSMIRDSLQGAPLQFVSTSYRNFQYNAVLPSGLETQINFPIPSKVSSLKSIFVTQRDKGTGANTFFPFSSVMCGIRNYYWRIGSQVVPSKPVNTSTEMAAELFKSIASLSDINHQPSIDKYSYNLSQSSASVEPVNGVSSGSFYIGIDMEQFPGSSKDTIFAGHNSTTEDIFLCATYVAPAAINARLDAFAMFDQVIVFQDNTAYIKM